MYKRVSITPPMVPIDNALAVARRVSPLKDLVLSLAQWKKVEIGLTLIKPFVDFCSDQGDLLGKLFTPIPLERDVCNFYLQVSKHEEFVTFQNRYVTAIAQWKSLTDCVCQPVVDGVGFMALDEKVRGKVLSLSLSVFGPLEEIPKDVSLSQYLVQEIENRFTHFCKNLIHFFQQAIDNIIKVPIFAQLFWVRGDTGLRLAQPGELIHATSGIKFNWKALYINFMKMQVMMQNMAEEDSSRPFVTSLGAADLGRYIVNAADTIKENSLLLFSNPGLPNAEALVKQSLSLGKALIIVVDKQKESTNVHLMITALYALMDGLTSLIGNDLIPKGSCDSDVEQIKKLADNLLSRVDEQLRKSYEKDALLFEIAYAKQNMSDKSPDYLKQINALIRLSKKSLLRFSEYLIPTQHIMLLMCLCELHVTKACVEICNISNLKKNALSQDLAVDINAQILLLDETLRLVNEDRDYLLSPNGDKLWALDSIKLLDSLMMLIVHWASNKNYIGKTPDLVFDIQPLHATFRTFLTRAANRRDSCLILKLNRGAYQIEKLQEIAQSCLDAPTYSGESQARVSFASVADVFDQSFRQVMLKIQDAQKKKTKSKATVPTAKQLSDSEKAMQALIKEEAAMVAKVKKSKNRHKWMLTVAEPETTPVTPALTAPGSNTTGTAETKEQQTNDVTAEVAFDVWKISEHKSYRSHYSKGVQYLKDQKYLKALVEFESVLQHMPANKEPCDIDIYLYCLYQTPLLISYASNSFFNLDKNSFYELERKRVINPIIENPEFRS